LLADQFQVDVYLGVGWRAGGSLGLSPSIAVRQVF
jgi:hypothetical protein